MPRYPKPDGEKVSRNAPAFAWATLPPRREGGAPPLPRGYRWREETIAWWEELWCRPQAAMWDPSGSTLEVYARLYDAMLAGGDVVRISAEMRQHEDRHGLNPKAMLQLRWRVAAEEEQIEQPPPVAADRRARLRIAG